MKEWLDDPSREAAEKLLADLPSLIPDDPALAAVIAEEMAKAMADSLAEGAAETGEITQAQAEQIYEEMMGL
ncbi:MAG: hypothetical protein ACI4Q3_08650 [Kiritimatiellia bacterium]